MYAYPRKCESAIERASQRRLHKRAKYLNLFQLKVNIEKEATQMTCDKTAAAAPSVVATNTKKEIKRKAVDTTPPTTPSLTLH